MFDEACRVGFRDLLQKKAMMFAIKHWDSCTFSHSPILGPYFSLVKLQRKSTHAEPRCPSSRKRLTGSTHPRRRWPHRRSSCWRRLRHMPWLLAPHETSEGCRLLEVVLIRLNRDKPGHGIIPYGSLWIQILPEIRLDPWEYLCHLSQKACHFWFTKGWQKMMGEDLA